MTYDIFLDDLPPRAIALWMYLMLRANKHGQCWPSIDRIAAEMHTSRSTIKRAIQDLEETGWLETKQRYRPDGSKASLLFTVKM